MSQPAESTFDAWLGETQCLACATRLRSRRFGRRRRLVCYWGGPGAPGASTPCSALIALVGRYAPGGLMPLCRWRWGADPAPRRGSARSGSARRFGTGATLLRLRRQRPGSGPWSSMSCRRRRRSSGVVHAVDVSGESTFARRGQGSVSTSDQPRNDPRSTPDRSLAGPGSAPRLAPGRYRVWTPHRHQMDRLAPNPSDWLRTPPGSTPI